MLANIKKKLSFIILSIISIFIFSSCSGGKTEITDININQEYKFDIKLDMTSNVYVYKFFSSKNEALFINYNLDAKYTYLDLYIFNELTFNFEKKVTKNDIKTYLSSCIYNSLFDSSRYDDEIKHSYKKIDKGFFGTIDAEKNKEYYVICIAESLNENVSNGSFDLLLYDESYYDSEAIDWNSQWVGWDYSQTYSCKLDNDFVIIRFSGLNNGIYNFCFQDITLDEIAVDYSKKMINGFNLDNVLCTYYLNDKSIGGDDVISFNLTISSDDTFYLRLRKKDFSPFAKVHFWITFLE